jgi:phenylacetyl-CoA:acceptor oxidoreductase subunit 2
MLRDNASFRMHEHLETSPGFHYLWDGGASEEDVAPPEFPDDGGTGMQGVSPWKQRHWDWRAAGNFILGGAGTGLFAVYAALGLTGVHLPLAGLLALICVALGLGSVWLEIGRKLRALNVYRNARTSWMTREAMAAMVFLPLGAASLPWPMLALPAAAAGLLFLYCQGRILQASKGIPVWRLAEIVPLIISTSLTEGLGLLLLAAPVMALADHVTGTMPLALALLVLLAARALVWQRYVWAAATATPSAAFKKLAGASPWFLIAGHILPVLLASLAFIRPDMHTSLLTAAGLLALAGGWAMKALLVTTAAYNQGYAISRTPARGSGGGGMGARPGWSAGP